MRKKNYLNNKDILAEIHKSKNTFCTYTRKEFADYDLIVHSVDDIDENAIYEALQNRAKQMSQAAFGEAKEAGEKLKQADCEVSTDAISPKELVFRVMTFDHIPDQPGRKKNPKTVADTKVKLNFPPFQHWKLDENNELECVGKSHWSGDLETGEFSLTSGQATDKLALMWLKLIDRYATRGNVRGYTYNDEMKGQAVLQLAQIGLQFDESKSQNPFAYYTAAVTNSFVRVINIEKRNQNIRDDILEMNDLTPSYTRQHDGEWAAEQRRNDEID